MAIKFEINLTNKWLYSLIIIGVLLILGVGVWAYNSGTSPDVMGHSFEELEEVQKQIEGNCSGEAMVGVYENGSVMCESSSGGGSCSLDCFTTQLVPERANNKCNYWDNNHPGYVVTGTSGEYDCDQGWCDREYICCKINC